MKKQKKFWFWYIFICLMFIFIPIFICIISINNKNTDRNKKIFISIDDSRDNTIKIKQGDDWFCFNLLERKILNQFVSEHSKKYNLKEGDLKLLHINIVSIEENFNYFIAIIKIQDNHPKYTGNIKMRFKIEWERSKNERELIKNYWNKFLYINNN